MHRLARGLRPLGCANQSINLAIGAINRWIIRASLRLTQEKSAENRIAPLGQVLDMSGQGDDVRPPGAGRGDQHDRSGFEQPIDLLQEKRCFLHPGFLSTDFNTAPSRHKPVAPTAFKAGS
jgi:hypothetical protein